MASPEAQLAHDAMRLIREVLAGSADRVPTLSEQRADLASMVNAASIPEGVIVTVEYAGDCEAYWHDPPGGAEDRAVLFLHGGGYTLGSPATHERMAGHLALVAGCRVLNLEYRLAPEHRHPAAVEDASAAYRWLLEQGYGPEHIAIAGDSSGGGLTLAMLLAIRDQGLPQPAAAVAMSPWTDLEATGESMVSNAAVDLLVWRSGVLQSAADFLAPGHDPRDPLASPLHGDYREIAPLLFQVGGDETLLDDSRRVAAKAQAAGVDVRLEVYPEMQHVFQASVGKMPEATEAFHRAGEWLRPRLGL